MASLSLAERARIALLSADRSRRAAMSALLYSPALRWRFGSPIAGQLLIVPQDLRTADPSFWREVQLGQFGLAGTIAQIDDKSPFVIAPPNADWARALHGFAWLRDLESAASDDARDAARRLTLEWTLRQRSGTGLAWEPGVIGRRLISWISHANLLLDGADARTYDGIMGSLGAQIIRLSATWRDGSEGYPRLQALVALVFADLCVAGRDRGLAEAEAHFSAEIERQIFLDGGHVTRNPAVLVELMLDLLPLRQCFASRKRAPPQALTDAAQRMLGHLRLMRLGDGLLSRFNGNSVALPAGLATVLAYDDRPSAVEPWLLMPQSKYVRAQRGETVVLVDTGAPPPLNVASHAHAGCLSFEMSSGPRAVFVNGGAPGSANEDWRAIARSTASHNTLCLNEKSSSRLVRNARLEGILGSPPIRGPDSVECRLGEEEAGSLEVNARHDGYIDRFGLIHSRSLVLNADGCRLLGIDRLAGPKGPLRLKDDLPFAIHFHMHPDVVCHRGGATNTAEIVVKNGEAWAFTLEGARLSIEESTYFADSAGPRRAQQVVARGATFGQTDVRWVLEKRRDSTGDENANVE